MIDARELRIGNLITYLSRADTEVELEVSVVDLFRIEQDFDAYSPIPINEEWIERLGFNTPTNEYPYHFRTGGIDYFWATGRVKAFTLGVPWASFPCYFCLLYTSPSPRDS